jgi:hypothetical protein
MAGEWTDDGPTPESAPIPDLKDRGARPSEVYAEGNLSSTVVT